MGCIFMANNISEKNRLINQYFSKYTKTEIKKMKKNIINDINYNIGPHLNKIISMIDKLYQKKIIHINKSINCKKKILKYLYYI
jgi:ribosomal protein S20